MGKHRQYSDEDKANALAALAANNGNVKRTAIQLNIPHKTLDNWANGRIHPEVAKNGTEKKKDMAAALEDVAWKILDALPSKIGKAPLNQAAVAMGIAIDKARLLRGEPTEITQSQNDDRLRLFRERYSANRQEDAARPDGADPGGEPVHSSPADPATDAVP